MTHSRSVSCVLHLVDVPDVGAEVLELRYDQLPAECLVQQRRSLVQHPKTFTYNASQHSWARDNCLATRQRQRDNVMELQ